VDYHCAGRFDLADYLDPHNFAKHRQRRAAGMPGLIEEFAIPEDFAASGAQPSTAAKLKQTTPSAPFLIDRYPVPEILS